jgi:hypothetical protein
MRNFAIILFFYYSVSCGFGQNERHGWPEQKPPKGVIICEQGKNVAENMLLESLSGLAAQAVNAGSFDEMVWIKIANESYQNIFNQTTNTLDIQTPKKMSIWNLVDYLKKKGVIKGYVLYKLDSIRENPYASHPDADYSSNVATVYSSLLKGVMIDLSLREEARNHGLKELKNACKESPEECFIKNKDKLNNSSALSIPPEVPNLRDYAITHKLMLYADNNKKFINEVLEWVKPLSPILGWGCGDEYEFTSLISRWGEYNTATNWCWNLPFISSVSKQVPLKKANEISLHQIDFSDTTTSFHSYVMSDGDNMQWMVGSFIDNPDYLGNKDRGKVGLSWTLCPINLSVISPFTWNSIADDQSKNSSYIEYGGGYQYPDLFAMNRPNRLELLREFAKSINYNLQRLNIKIFGFICMDISSKEAQEAFQIYAEELKGITGMLAVQYFPYELDGKIYWETNTKGIDIPVVTARYSIWNEVSKARPRAGAPEYISSLINRDALTAKANNNYMLSWTIVHAWSDFSNTSKITETPAIGVNAVKTSKKLLINDVKTISVNELLWRIRMKYYPKQTKSLLNQ